MESYGEGCVDIQIQALQIIWLISKRFQLGHNFIHLIGEERAGEKK